MRELGLYLGLEAASISGFRAAFSAVVAHDATAGVVGTISYSGNAGAVSIVGGATTDEPGNNGGLFSVDVSLNVTFDVDAISLSAGQSLTTTDTITLTDGTTQIPVTLSVRVENSNALPVNTVAPEISGTAEVGQILSVSEGTWTGNPTPTITYQWTRDDVNIGGATANTYTLVGADDETDIGCTVTGTNSESAVTADATAVSVTYPAPSAAGGIADQNLTEDTGDQTVATASDFTGSGGAYSLTTSTTGISINTSTGLVTIDTDVTGVLSSVSVVARYTNSGGFADSGFSVTVTVSSVLTGPATVTAQELLEGSTSYPTTVSYTPTTDATGTVMALLIGSSAQVPNVTVDGVSAEFIGNASALHRETFGIDSQDIKGCFLYYADIENASTQDVVVSMDNFTGGSQDYYLIALDIVGLDTRTKRVYSALAERPQSTDAMTVSNTGLQWAENDVLIHVINGERAPAGGNVGSADINFGSIEASVKKTDALTAATGQTVTVTDGSFNKFLSQGVVLLSSDSEVAIRESARPTDWVFQRTFGGTSGSVPVSGTYDGSPSGIQCRVVDWPAGTEAVAWTTIDAAPSGGAFAGNITVPQGGPYNFEFRETGETEVFYTENRFGVGVVGGIYGQSNAGFMNTGPSDIADMPIGYPDVAMRYTNGRYYSPTGAGEATFAKAMEDLDGIPVMLCNGGISGQLISALSKGDASGHYDNFLDDLQEIAVNGAEFILWYQGEQDAVAGNASYAADLEALRADLESDLGQSANTLKLYACGLAHAASGGTNWSAINDEIEEAASTYANIIYSHTSADMERTDDFHAVASWYAKAGEKFARSLALETGSVTGSHQFEIASVAITSATVTTVTLTHGIGTDFTPTTGIAGFEVSNDSFTTPVTPSSAVRTDATTITLTHSDIGTSTRQLRYLFGPDPTGVGASGAPANIVIDNGSLGMPLNPVSTITAT